MGKDFDLLVSATVLPVWRRPPRNGEEIRARAALIGEFMATSKQLAAELKQRVMQSGQAAGGR